MSLRLPGRALALLLLLLAGCAGFDLSELPDAPLAVIYRNREETERIAERLANRKPKPPPAPGQAHVFRVETLEDALGLGKGRAERFRAGLQGRLAFVDPRTAEVRPANFVPRGARPLDWSSDHRRLLFVSRHRGSSQIYEWDTTSREVHPLTTGRGSWRGAAYGPGDARILVRVDPLQRGAGGGGSRLFLWTPGRRPQRLTDGPADGHPVVSPAGDLVVFNHADAQGRITVATVDPRGGPIRVLTHGRDASFSPDGSFLVYSARSRGHWKLWRMWPDGSGKHPFGKSPYDEHEPQVSPDGRFVVYLGTRQKVDPEPLLMVRPLAGGSDRPIEIDGSALGPIW